MNALYLLNCLGLLQKEPVKNKRSPSKKKGSNGKPKDERTRKSPNCCVIRNNYKKGREQVLFLFAETYLTRWWLIKITSNIKINSYISNNNFPSVSFAVAKWFRAVNYQSRGPWLKTTLSGSLVNSAFQPCEISQMSTKNSLELVV